MMETESQVSVSLPGERVSRLWPGPSRHHQDTVTPTVHPGVGGKQFFCVQTQMYLQWEMLSWDCGKKKCVCVCVCDEGRLTSGVCHAKRHRSSELSRELKDLQSADKDKTPGVCTCTVSVCVKQAVRK